MPNIEVKYGFRGPRGASAYQVWLSQGHTGTEADFVEWTRATLADVQVATAQPGTDVSYQNGVLRIPSGLTGPSAYEIWLSQGNTGSEADFIEWTRSGAADQVAEAQGLVEAAKGHEQGAKQAAEAATTNGAAQVSLAEAQVVIAQTAADRAISATVSTYTGTDAERIALTGMVEGETFYATDTGHDWRYSGTAWVDLGPGALALKADKETVDDAIIGGISQEAIERSDAITFGSNSLKVVDSDGNVGAELEIWAKVGDA